MDKRKGIILAVVIFLLIGLGTFVFANPSNESLNGNDNNSNNNDNTQNDNLDNEDTNDGSGEEGGEENTPNTDNNGGNSNNGSGSNSGLAQGDDEEDSTDVIIGDDSENQGGNADEETPGDDDDQNGEEPSEPIDTSAPIVTILDKTYQGLGNAIGYVNTDVVLSLTEENLTVTIEKDGETLTFENGMTLSSDGAYKLTVSDSNSNVTVVEFSIDMSAPVISGIKDGDITNTIGDIAVEDANEVIILLNEKEVSISDIANKVLEGVNTLTVKDSLDNEVSISFTYDTTPIVKEWLYALNQTYHNTNLEDKYYQVIGDNQKLYVELTFIEEFTSVPEITVGATTSEMVCGWTNWETERQYYKCDATITIDGTSQELINDEELPISITNIVDAAGNETTLDNDDITDNGTYGRVIYDSEAPVYASLGILNLTHLRENNNGASEELTVVNVDDEIRVLLRFNEILAVNPIIIIGGFDYELTLRTNYDNFAEYTYTADIKITEDMKLDNGNVDFEISGYADAAGNVGDVLTSSNINNNEYTGVELDTTAPVNTEIIFKNIDGNEQYAKVGDRVWLYLTFDERLAQDPTVTINGETAKRVQYKNGDNQDQDWEQYVFEYVVPEDVTEGKITFEVTNVIDKAGNPLKDTITNANTEDMVNADVTLPERGYSTIGFEYTESNDKSYEEIDGKKIYYVKEGDSFQYKIAFTEELQDGLIATIAGTPVELEFLTYNDANGYVYGGEYLVPAGLTEGEELEIIVSNIKDLAGNEYADKTITDVPTSNGRVAVYDNTNPIVKIYKNSIVDDNYDVTSSDKYNFYVGIFAEDKNIDKVLVNDEEYDYINMPAIGVNNDIQEYTVTAYDKAGNTATKVFTINTKKPIISINDNEYVGEEPGNNFIDAGRFDSAEVEIIGNNISSVKVWYNEELQDDYNTVDYTKEGLYQIEVRDEFLNKTKIEFYVGKYQATIELIAPDSLIYDGTSKEYTVNVYDVDGNIIEDPNMEIVYMKDNEIIYDTRTEDLRTLPIDAGTYRIGVHVRGNDDYVVANKWIAFEIEKAEYSIEIETPESLIYDTTAKEYEITIIGADGKIIENPSLEIIYQKDGEIIYDTRTEDLRTLPTNVGTYRLGIYVREDNNHVVASEWITFEIEKATPTIQLSEPTLIAGKFEGYQVTVIGADGKEIIDPYMNIVYQKDGQTIYESKNPSAGSLPNEEGTYRLGIYVGPTENYTRADLWMNFEILPEDTITIVDGVAYNNLQDAINNANGETIKLLDDVNTNSLVKLTSNNNANVTIDLNGKSINLNTNSYFLVSNGTLNLIGEGTIKETKPYYAPIMVSRSASDTGTTPIIVNVGEDVTLEGWAGIFIDKNSSKRVANTTVNFSGTINSVRDTTNAAGHGIYINGEVKDTTSYPVINIENTAKITSEGVGIYAAGYATWNIKGGYIEAPETVIGIKSGNLNITGGTLVATGEKDIPTASNNNGINGSGVPIQIESNVNYAGKININITGGTFESKNTTTVYEYTDGKVTDTNVESVVISGGTFISNGGDNNIIGSEYFNQKLSRFITGGTFNSNISQYVADGYEVIQNGTNYEVVKA